MRRPDELSPVLTDMQASTQEKYLSPRTQIAKATMLPDKTKPTSHFSVKKNDHLV
jgi:hypothetical protein